MINSALTAHLRINCVSQIQCNSSLVVALQHYMVIGKQNILSLFFCILWINLGLGQDSLNLRLLNNVFDVYRLEGDSLNIVPVDTFGVKESDNIVISEESISSDEQNPFEVNHIPIRRNQLVDKSITDSKETPLDFFRKHLGLWAIILMVILIAVALGLNRDIIGKMVRALINDNHLLIFHREEQAGLSPASLLLLGNCMLGLSLLLVHMQAETKLKTLSSLLVVTVLLGALYLSKYLILNFIKWVYPGVRKIINFYLSLSVSILGVLGVLLTILNFFIHYGPSLVSSLFVYISLIIIGLSYLFRYGRTMLSHFYLLSNNAFFFLLYLCATEIAPVIIIYKVVVDHLSF